MAAAAFSREGLRRIKHHNYSLQQLWRQGIEHSPRYQAASPCNYGNQFRQSKSFSRFTQSSLRKIKELDLFANGRMFTRFSSLKPSSSAKFSVVGWYLGVLQTRPIVTKSVTSALIYTAADVSSQTIVGEQYDVIRTLRMAGYGMLILGPSLHYWYNFMSRVFPNRDLLSTLKKIASGQILFGPAMTTVFFSANAALQGESSSEIIAKLGRDLFPTIISGIMYWPVCDFITFRFIPVQLQPLVANSFSYLWTIYLTYMANLAKDSAV